MVFFHFIIIFSLFITTINDLVSEFQSMMVSGQDTQKNVHVHLLGGSLRVLLLLPPLKLVVMI
jgi:hypothetical protein